MIALVAVSSPSYWTAPDSVLVQVAEEVAQAPPGVLERVAPVLFVLLVLSVVFEVALTPIFKWRVFLTHFEGKGVKTPVTVLLALLVFWAYDLDVIRDLLVALGYAAKKTFGGQLLTALVIAGGSDGVLRIFTRLKIRDPEARRAKALEAQQARGQRPAAQPGAP